MDDTTEKKAPEIWIPGITDVEEDRAQYKDAKFESKPHGMIFVNGQEVAATLMCPHCMMHFISRKGSGHRRAFCMKCMAVTCGRLQCDVCTPVMAEFEMNAGREF